MAVPVIFEGRKVTLPGIYTATKSGIKNPPISLAYGNVLIIDTGSGANYGGGAGINGALSHGLDSVYPIDNIDDFQKMVKGGVWYTLSKPLFKPLDKPGINGISLAYYVRAATTTCGIMTFAPTGGGAAGGTFTMKCRDEGIIGNGILDTGNELRKGYAFKMTAGVKDPTKFILNFYLGTYTGTDSDGYPYGDVLSASSAPKKILSSIEFSNIAALITWATNDSTFQNYFAIGTATVTGTGVVTSADLTTYTAYSVAAGGTETFGDADFSAVLAAVATLRYSFILSDKAGDNAQNAKNDLLLTHVLDSNTSYEKMIFVGGGIDNTKWGQTNGSIPTAQHFNSDKVVTVHGGVKIDSAISVTKTRIKDTLYSAALVLGRIAGLAPQTPGTFKILPISGVVHQLTNSEKEDGLAAGVLMIHLDTQLLTPAYTILQAINTLQNNSNMINEDGTTNEISIRRISAQLNANITVNARRDLFGNESGPNINTLSNQFVSDWVKGQLQNNTATATQDDMIIAYRNIVVTTMQDAKIVTYEFKPNSPINKFFVTGFMIS
jgi:hypothetical protein